MKIYKIFILFLLAFIPFSAYSGESDKIEYPEYDCKKTHQKAVDYAMQLAMAFSKKDIDCLARLLHLNGELSKYYEER